MPIFFTTCRQHMPLRQPYHYAFISAINRATPLLLHGILLLLLRYASHCHIVTHYGCCIEPSASACRHIVITLTLICIVTPYHAAGIAAVTLLLLRARRCCCCRVTPRRCFAMPTRFRIYVTPLLIYHWLRQPLSLLLHILVMLHIVAARIATGGDTPLPLFYACFYHYC